ncbi:MAG: YjbQ family protein [Candidatus Omnitrophica bacterium]|nr:YjbQ family protein [Candidatus Omnitrophota bacterium]
MTYEVDVRSSKRSQFIEITDKIRKIVKDSGVVNGLCYVYVPHTTAAIMINENADPSVKKDLSDILERLVPKDASYSHSEGNSDAHAKASVLGTEKTIFIDNASLRLGTWQGVFFCEFDGPRTRNVWVKVLNA